MPEIGQVTLLEQKLREQALRSQAILSTTVDGIITVDQHGVIESFNAAAEELFGYAAEEIIGQNVNRLMNSPDADNHDAHIRRYLQTGQAKVIGTGREVMGRRKDGSAFPMNLAVSQLHLDGPDGPYVLFTGIVRDLTAWKRLEHQVLESSDREKRRLGQDLHDGLGQQLAGIGFLCKALESRLKAAAPVEAEELRQITELVSQAIVQARAIARGLQPVEDRPDGLMTALQALAENTSGLFRTSCQFACPNLVLVEDQSVAVQLYRIAQEAVSNAVRHGKPHHLWIMLDPHGQGVSMAVSDDGVGLPARFAGPAGRGVSGTSGGGMGINIMRYRASLIGAALDFSAGKQGGTIVSCIWEPSI